nr:DUF4131 domain-containing protein [Chloroflexota bacterium]
MVPRVAWLAVGTVASALIARHVPGTGWLVPLIVAAAIALVRPASRVAAIAFGVGVALVLLRIGIGVLVAPPLTTLPLTEDARDWVGQVVTLGTPGDGRQRAFVDVTAADAAAGSPSVRIYAQLPRYPELAPGDRIVFRGALEPPPEGPGFADYLARNGAVATCRIRSFSPGGVMPGPLPDLERARRDTADLLARVLPAQEAGLAAGMLIGLRDRVDRQVAADFTASGLSHVVAISGW